MTNSSIDGRPGHSSGVTGSVLTIELLNTVRRCLYTRPSRPIAHNCPLAVTAQKQLTRGQADTIHYSPCTDRHVAVAYGR